MADFVGAIDQGTTSTRFMVFAPVLGWDDAAADREIEHYRARVAAERESQEQQDDHTADAARLGAPDVRAGALG